MLPSPFLIGLASDGTAFDNLNFKHLEAFIPAALETWHLTGPMADRFTEIEKAINLSSSIRGVNRFPGLLEAFELLEAAFPTNPALPPTADLRAFIAGETLYSTVSLKKWMETHPSRELEKVLAWSNRADELFNEKIDDLKAYPGVKEALEAASACAAVAVVSSAARESLEKGWSASGLAPYVDLMMSQEDGSKAVQLTEAMKRCGSGVKALMLGSTETDGLAAREAGTMFFPIMPGNETASWAEFKSSILPLFLAGQYTKEMEAEYYGALKKLLV